MTKNLARLSLPLAIVEGRPLWLAGMMARCAILEAVEADDGVVDYLLGSDEFPDLPTDAPPVYCAVFGEDGFVCWYCPTLDVYFPTADATPARQMAC
jgi:hypothetical protein